MYRGRTVAVIVPAYNEEEHVGEVLATIPQFVDRVYAVDDRSTDNTWQIIQSIAADELSVRDRDVSDQLVNATADHLLGRDPTGVTLGSIADGGTLTTQRIVPIRHGTNCGAGAALRTGYLRALDDRIDIVVTMDADGQMDPAHLPRLLDPIVDDVADYAKGNRLASPDDRRSMPGFRRFGNQLLALLTKVSSGYWGISDPQNGYTAISHGALARVGIQDIPDDHNYTNDMLVRLNARELRVADVPMPAVYNDEESTIRYRTFVPRTSLTLLRGFLYRLYSRFEHERRDPVPVLYAGGVTSASVSLAAVVYGLLGGSASAVTIVFVASILALCCVLAAITLDARRARALEVVA